MKPTGTRHEMPNDPAKTARMLTAREAGKTHLAIALDEDTDTATVSHHIRRWRNSEWWRGQRAERSAVEKLAALRGGIRVWLELYHDPESGMVKSLLALYEAHFGEWNGD